MDDADYMRRALELAVQARGRTSPNPLVGAVIVREGKVVGEGYHRRAGLPHAEVEALQAAGERARGATVYVNLEPCCHFGRTPPCTEALIAAGVRRVVVAMEDPNPQVQGRGLAKLRAAGIEVTAGVREPEARRLNEVYCQYITARRPFVLLKCALTLDGKIATRTGDSRWISGREARAWVHRLREEYDAVMVGSGTVLADDPLLTARPEEFGEVLPAGGPPQPLRVIVDSRARTPVEARVVQTAREVPTLIATLPTAPAEKRAAWVAAGVEVLVLPERDGHVDLVALMQALGKREVTSVLLEGGGTLNAAALAAGVVHKVLFFIAPKLCGGQEAPTPVEGPGVTQMKEALRLREVEVTRCGEDVAVMGYLLPRESEGKLPD
ncbi:MAG TPA: bifunctional diaminohydroxyphosphoribosylaminopyrimidine deaminase/5-amino-6-(5-phosphoribosylamino)uracil reductase RibD [Armatimonadetes bacterium]|nr:bifunctional diaminohydroxyphosphoribosylaminopyrimidine deaminase/5-amino-6-(5-phosphoribosylamino)uracil reductase RibD [Armatimonadota bacterium]